MIGSTRQVSVWAYGAPADLRKGFDGLSGLVSQRLSQDPLWRDTDRRVVRLTMSELQLFLEGSTLVGRVALSPAPFLIHDAQELLARRAR